MAKKSDLKVKEEENKKAEKAREKELKKKQKEEEKVFKEKVKKADKSGNKKGKKKKTEPMDIFKAVIAALLCIMMLASVCGTLVYYLIAG